MRRQRPLNCAPSSTTNAGAVTCPLTFAVRPSTSSLLARMSPSTVPFIFATATLITALVTSAPVLTMRVPFCEMTFPEKCPSIRSIDLNCTSPVKFTTSPTKPSQLSFTGAPFRSFQLLRFGRVLCGQVNAAGVPLPLLKKEENLSEQHYSICVLVRNVTIRLPFRDVQIKKLFHDRVSFTLRR